MPQEAKSFDPGEELKSVPSIPAKNENGHLYIHNIEPELVQPAYPRRVESPAIAWSAVHTWLLNISLGFSLLSVYFGRRFHVSDADSVRFATSILAIIGAFLLICWFGHLSSRRHQLDFLRNGVATVGVFTSGTVNDCEETTYRLVYNFRVDARLHTDTVSVTKNDYVRYTTGNPYFTVLYRGKSLVDSAPYFQIAGLGKIV